MSLNRILDYLTAPYVPGEALREGYGTEHFGMFLYALTKMERPRVAVELGTGQGATSLLIGQALSENGVGRLWTVDNGECWEELRALTQASLGYDEPGETYAVFLNRILRKFELEASITHVDQTLREPEFFAPAGDKIDLLFCDAPSARPSTCINLLRYYLPRLSDYSSIFMDRTSTFHPSYMMLNFIVEQLNARRIPLQLRAQMPGDELRALERLVQNSKFTIVHLTDHDCGKVNAMQNSRTWIKIEPHDCYPRSEASSFDGAGGKIAVRSSATSTCEGSPGNGDEG